jgi:hypothetical protein
MVEQQEHGKIKDTDKHTRPAYRQIHKRSDPQSFADSNSGYIRCGQIHKRSDPQSFADSNSGYIRCGHIYFLAAQSFSLFPDSIILPCSNLDSALCSI